MVCVIANQGWARREIIGRSFPAHDKTATS